MGLNNFSMLKVSVIMSTYNRAHMVCRAIDSFKNQIYENAELIIVNNGSTDNTKEILAQYEGVENIFISHLAENDPNVGNRLWELAHSELICQLHDDDQFTKYSLFDRVALFEGSNLQVVYGGVIEQDLAGYPMRDIPAQLPNKARILKDEYINFTTMMWRRNLPFRFDTDLSYYSDWFFKIRCLNECLCSYVDSAVMRYTIHPGQESVRLRGTGAGEDEIMRGKIKMLGYGR